MKLFRQKDELFELMAKATSKNNPEAAPAIADGTSSTSRRPKTTPTTRPIARPAPVSTTSTTSSSSSSSSTPSSIGGEVGGASSPVKRITTTKGARPFGVQPGGDSGSFASPLGGPPIQRPLGELIEIDGDALVVLDDDWEAAAPPSEPGRLLALRLDTAVVGGLLVVGLLATAFLVGRTSSDDVSKLPTIAQAPVVEASFPDSALTGALPAASIGGSTAPKAGFRPGTNAGQTPTQAPAQGGPAAATPAAPERSAAKGGYEICVVSTKPEKATAVAKWLNENPRSPIFGRTDLEATASKGGSVKIVGFQKQESDVLTRVRATSDPTGGSGTFHDAFCRPVR